MRVLLEYVNPTKTNIKGTMYAIEYKGEEGKKREIEAPLNPPPKKKEEGKGERLRGEMICVDKILEKLKIW